MNFFFEQVDLISAMTNSEARDHLLGALPTGYGKSLPMLVASLLLPPGTECENLHLLAVLKFDFHRLADMCQILAVRSDICKIGQLSVGQLSVDHGQLSEETVSALKKL